MGVSNRIPANDQGPAATSGKLTASQSAAAGCPARNVVRRGGKHRRELNRASQDTALLKDGLNLVRALQKAAKEIDRIQL